MLGLDVLDGYSLLEYNVTNRLWCNVITQEDPPELKYIWSEDLHRFYSHISAEMWLWLHTVYISKQLDKLHREFVHRSATKLDQLLKIAGKEVVTPKTLENSISIAARFGSYQKISNAPTRFRVTMGMRMSDSTHELSLTQCVLTGSPCFTWLMTPRVFLLLDYLRAYSQILPEKPF